MVLRPGGDPRRTCRCAPSPVSGTGVPMTGLARLVSHDRLASIKRHHASRSQPLPRAAVAACRPLSRGDLPVTWPCSTAVVAGRLAGPNLAGPLCSLSTPGLLGPLGRPREGRGSLVPFCRAADAEKHTMPSRPESSPWFHGFSGHALSVSILRWACPCVVRASRERIVRTRTHACCGSKAITHW